MRKTATLFCYLFASTVVHVAKAGFVTRLLEKKPDQEMNYTNLQEYYGRFDDFTQKADGSQAYFVMLMSYEYATETIRFHFNMKEPGREGDDDGFAETDVQWNTMLDLKNPSDQIMVNPKNEIIELETLVTVFGYHDEQMTQRRTCHFDIQLTEKDDQVHIELLADPLAGGSCLHRDKLEVTALEEETDEATMVRDDMFFKNMEALESTLTVATFDEEGVKGTWKVTQDDLYNSDSKYKDFFMLVNEDVSEKTQSTVVYKIKDYDMVGPEEFHEDRPYDKNRDKYGRPWLSININFVEAGRAGGKNKKTKDVKKEMDVQLIYPLDERHLMINKAKRSFRATKPNAAHVSMDDGVTNFDCSDLTLQFRVHDSFVIYVLEDQNDECFPYTVEGKWHLELTADEELENLMEMAMAEDLANMSEAEKEDEVMGNDLLVDTIADEVNHMTMDQLKMLEDLANGVDDRMDKLKQRQQKRWDTNYVNHDIAKKKKEQGNDWYEHGKKSKHRLTDEETSERSEEQKAVKESWEIQGALYAVVVVAVFGAIYYYFCVRRKRLRNQHWTDHVMPSEPTFA